MPSQTAKPLSTTAENVLDRLRSNPGVWMTFADIIGRRGRDRLNSAHVQGALTRLLADGLIRRHTEVVTHLHLHLPRQWRSDEIPFDSEWLKTRERVEKIVRYQLP